MTPELVHGVPVDGLLPEDRVALQALVDAAYRKAPELRNLDAMRVGKMAEDVERYSALNARLFAEKTAAQIELEELREALFRLWPAVEKAMAGLVFTAERAGEVQADMNTLRANLKTPEFECLGEPSLCTNPRGCACVPDSKTPNVEFSGGPLDSR